MTEATIGCSKDVKARIESIKEDHETFDGVLIRLVENYHEDGQRWTESELEAKIKDMVVREALE
jgi:predicted CopG family antitoxin